jgi:hypothetical protein
MGGILWATAAVAGETPPILVPQDYAGIQAAIDAAPTHGARVVVAPGTYAELLDFQGKDLLLASTDPMDDDVVAATIIDGGNGNLPVVRFSPPADTSKVAGALQGFTVTGGGAATGAGILVDGAHPDVWRCVVQGNSTPDNGSGRGGGIACLHGATPSFRACVVRDNSAGSTGLGGGAYWDSLSTPTFDECVFQFNQSGSGGGLYVSGGGDRFPTEGGAATVAASTISSNAAANCGGGVYCRDANPLFRDCEVIANHAKTGAGIYLLGESEAHFEMVTVRANATTTGEGGGAYILFADSLQSMWDHCTFEADTAEFSGGAVYALSSDPSFTRCSFYTNELRADWSPAGGAVFCQGSRATFIACLFDANRAVGTFGGSGAALYARASQPLLENCLFSRNSARTSGAAVTFERQVGEPRVVVPEMRHCTIVWNSVDNYDSGAVTMIGWSRPLIENTILWANEPAAIDTLQGAPEVVYSCISDGWEGEGNLLDRPLLVRTPPYIWALHPLSPCIDTGVGDADGVEWAEVDTLYARFNTASPDMGIYGGPLGALWFADIQKESWN